MNTRRIVATTAFFLAAAASAQTPPPGSAARPAGALSPKDELGTFQVMPGFKVELVAAEPEVIDPVAMCFDERGRIFVCEMRGYPNGGVGTGNETRGRIRCLTDRDGDGVFEMATVYADGLRFPMGVTPWRGGVIAAIAPDIVYLEDQNGDGQADKKTVLYTGFNLANIQQMVNTLQWSADGWVYGLAGNNAGTIRSAQKPDTPAITLQARGFRFKPDVPGSLEPTSGGGQYGLSQDDFGHWFTATNSQHLRQIVIPDHYLRRNPSALVTAVTLDIPDHGASCKLYRVSPFEAWRVERTTRRAGGADARRFSANELVPGGFATSSCSPIVYTAELFPEQYRNSVYVCDPANNLVHRDVLDRAGAVFVARRGEQDREFFAATDNWCRPVSLSVGPDGAVYLLDFYREAIETPLSLPDDIKAKMNLESGGRGRIWRIAPTDFKAGRWPDLSTETTAQLADRLTSSIAPVRVAAHRLLYERNDKSATRHLQPLADRSRGRSCLPTLLLTLEHFGALTNDTLLAALKDPLPGNREVALRLCEPRLEGSQALSLAVQNLADDTDPMVRFQVALTAGFMPPRDAAGVLARILRKDAGDTWVMSAILCSARGASTDLITAILTADAPTADKIAAVQGFLTKAAAAVGATRADTDLTRLVALVAEGKGTKAGLDLALLEGLGQGMRAQGGLRGWLTKPPANANTAVEQLRRRFDHAAGVVGDENATPLARVSAARLLAFAPVTVASPALLAGLSPQSPAELQLAAARSLAAHDDDEVTRHLLERWPQFGPALRREIVEQTFAVPARVVKLLDAVEKGVVKPSDLEPARIAQLKAHANPTVRTRATRLFAGQGSADRRKVIEEFRPLLGLTGAIERGTAVFKQHCAACHKLGNEGHEVGPNLLAVVPGKSGEDLLTAVLDPNREVDPRYMNYLADTVDGRSLTGIVVAETSAAITLRRADGAEDTIRRADLDRLRSSGLSLMPEGLEKSVSKQDVADLLAYLRSVAAKAPAPAKK